MSDDCCSKKGDAIAELGRQADQRRVLVIVMIINAVMFLMESIATFGLIITILGTVRYRRDWVPASVALYIVAAYWFTSSTSFANPAITVARSLTNTFAGISPHDVPLFIVAQLLGAGTSGLVAVWLFEERRVSRS